MKELWRYECITCGNGCLVKWDEGRPTVCHDGCDNPDWKLLKYQEPYTVNGDVWVHPLGEI